MSRRWFWAILIAILVVGGLVLRDAGAWLIVDDPLQPSDAVVVLGGGAPFRAMEAADVYKQGAARQVWLTRGEVFAEDRVLQEMHIHRLTDYEVSQMVLEHLGVPDTAIRVLPDDTPNTADEVRVAARELHAVGGSRVILVTSKYHARRVRTIWNHLVGKTPEAIVRVSRTDVSDPAHWWRHTIDATFVWREWFAILNVLAGFPIPH